MRRLPPNVERVGLRAPQEPGVQPGVPLPRRAALDALAALLTVAVASACLGLALLYFGVSGQDVHVSAGKLTRWVAVALPMGGFIVFVLSLVRRTPWFAGMLAAFSLFVVPVPVLWMLPGFVVLCVVIGAVDAAVRARRVSMG